MLANLETILESPKIQTLDLSEFTLPWDISSFKKFCKTFGFKDPQEVEPFFKAVAEYPLQDQWRSAKARALVQIIREYSAFKNYLRNQPFAVPFLAKQTALDQWILWANHLTTTYAEQPTQQILVITRLLNTTLDNEQAQSHFSDFIHDLRDHFPSHLQSIIDDWNVETLCPSTQSPTISTLVQIYLASTHPLSTKDRMHLQRLLNFKEDITLPLLGELYGRLNPFPQAPLLEAVSNTKLSLEALFSLCSRIPTVTRTTLLMTLSKQHPELNESIFKRFGLELSALSATEQSTISEQIRSEAMVPPEFKAELSSLQKPSQPLSELEKNPIGKTKAKLISFTIKSVIVLDFTRTLYWDMFKRKLLNADANKPYYDERMAALRTILHKLDSEALSQVEDSSVGLFANCLRPIADHQLLFNFAKALDEGKDQRSTYDNLVKDPNPFTSLAKAFTISVKACF
ncbi:MAG: hypothetical protein U1E78_07190 [Gammaproteobacteria bacterium]